MQAKTRGPAAAPAQTCCVNIAPKGAPEARCGRPSVARGWCPGHYQQAKRSGQDPSGPLRGAHGRPADAQLLVTLTTPRVSIACAAEIERTAKEQGSSIYEVTQGILMAWAKEHAAKRSSAQPLSTQRLNARPRGPKK